MNHQRPFRNYVPVNSQDNNIPQGLVQSDSTSIQDGADYYQQTLKLKREENMRRREIERENRTVLEWRERKYALNEQERRFKETVVKQRRELLYIHQRERDEKEARQRQFQSMECRRLGQFKEREFQRTRRATEQNRTVVDRQHDDRVVDHEKQTIAQKQNEENYRRQMIVDLQAKRQKNEIQTFDAD